MRTFRPMNPRAFSLVEVLIAVVVLAIGLLGLGMVFPVVVRQQRLAQDSIQGLSAARSAAVTVESRTALNKKLHDLADKMSKNTSLASRWVYAGGASKSDFALDPATGEMSIKLTGTPTLVGVGERLSPQPFTTPGGPQFVWDLAVLPYENDTDPDFLVAVVTRRVDAGIRIPFSTTKDAHWSLSNVLSGLPPGFPKDSVRSPVAVDSKGRPTLSGADETGRPNYATLRTANLRFPLRLRPGDPVGPPSYLDMDPALDSSEDGKLLLQFARTPGQKLIDTFGGVNTVLRGDEQNKYRVQLDRPISPALWEALRKLPSGGSDPKVMPVLLSPQPPAGVEIVRFTRS